MSHTVTVDAHPVSQTFAVSSQPVDLAKDSLAPAFSLPCVLTLEVPVLSFTVGSLMSLSVGSIVETATQQNEDLELSVNGQHIGTVEIEVTGDNLAVRLTGIA